MNKIITISREFGSGGREFGCRLAENLGIKYYDKEIISKIASKADLSEGYVKEVVEKRPMPLFPMTIGATFAAVATPMDFGSILTSSANGSCRRRAMETAPR